MWTVGSKEKKMHIPEHLSNVNEINQHSILTNRPSHVSEQFCFPTITADEKFSSISTIKTDTQGNDRLPISFVKLYCSYILLVLVRLTILFY